MRLNWFDRLVILCVGVMFVLSGVAIGFTAGRLSVPEVKCGCSESNVAPEYPRDKALDRQVDEFYKHFNDLYK